MLQCSAFTRPIGRLPARVGTDHENGSDRGELQGVGENGEREWVEWGEIETGRE